jgi:hypothetical protein
MLHHHASIALSWFTHQASSQQGGSISRRPAVVLSIVFTARIRADHASNEGDVGPELTFVKARHGKSRCKRLSQNRCLYSITTNQAAIIARVINRYVGNLPPMPGVFPDYPAPVIRNTDNGTELATMRLA